MAITTIKPDTNHRPTFTARPRESQGFAALLESQGSPPPAERAEPLDSSHTPLPAEGESPNALIPLGEINATAPSVSHLLQNHPDLRPECWQIIFAEVNRGKRFTTMRPGMQVAVNPATKELVWAEGKKRPTPPAGPVTGTDSGRITLGAISREAPTISHLLQRDPRFHAQAWEIIFAAVNRAKPYASLKPGSLVAIDAQTLELSFPDQDQSPPAAGPISLPTPQVATGTNPEPAPEQREFAARLTESVRSYLGRPYQALDCYGLVVRGLKDQGVHYGGENGLRQRLEAMAQAQGLPNNAFHNGEGLIEIAGRKVFDHSFVRVSDAKGQAREVLNALTPHLQEGMLLSFSTPTRGHTGVIAKKEGQWTYVNSGVIDHEVNGGKVSWRVGEESLAAEIENWLLLAKDHGASLKVSAGLFDTAKLKATASLTTAGRSAEKELSGGREG